MRILFVKTSSLGDVIHHCPAVTDVLAHAPGAEVDWVVEAPFAEVAALHPGVRRVLPVSVRRWRAHLLSASTWSEIGAFRRQLAATTYDRVIDTQGLLKSALIARTARGVRHGYDAASAREPIASRFYQVHHAVPRHLHAVERNRRLTAASMGMDAGIAADIAAGRSCDYGLRPAAGAAEVAGVGLGEAICVLLTMSSRADKLWPEADWVALARWLASRGLRVVLPWGSEAERARCERIALACEAAVVPPRMGLAALSAVLARARAVVGVDTGLSHLAVALGVPTVGIYASTDPALTGLYGGTAALRNLGGLSGAPTEETVRAALEPLL